MVDKFLSKNFRRQRASSTKHFVDTALRRHSASSTDHFIDRIRGFGCGMCGWVWGEGVCVGEDVECGCGCGCESVVYSTTALIPTASIYKDSLTFFHCCQTNKANYEIHLNFCSDGEKNEKKIIIFQRNVLSTKYPVDEMFCRRKNCH
jgi:hypothetical protein